MGRRPDRDMPPELRDREWMHARYVGQNLSVHELAARLRVGHTTVIRYLDLHGIPRRVHTVRRRKPTSKPPDRRIAEGATLMETLDAYRDLHRQIGPVSSKTLATRVREVGRAAATADRYHLRSTLIALAACALEWADRLPAPRA